MTNSSTSESAPRRATAKSDSAKRPYFFPETGITVEAVDLEAATKEHDKLKEGDQEN